jgi:cytoskeletal protein CcmA (bactofilin family)
MARERAGNGSPPESVISIIGPGMKVVGDCQTDGTIRIEGTVSGSIQAGKAVVVGREATVDGDITTQDAVIAGAVHGTLVAASRLELQATSRIEGDVRARRMHLEEGAILNGTVQMGEFHSETEASFPTEVSSPATEAPSA